MGRYSNLTSEKPSQLQALLARCVATPSRQFSHVARSKQRQTRLKPGEIDSLIAAYRAGSNLAEVAELFGVHKTTVAAHLDRHGISRRYQSLTPTQVQKASELYADGWSCARIGRKLSCDNGTVWRALKKADLELRQPWSRSGSSRAADEQLQ